MARTDTTGTLACTSFNALASSTTTGFAETAARTTGTTANVFDAQVRVTVTVGAITPSASTVINIYAYGAIDGTWPGGAATAEVIDGTDKALTTSSLGNGLRFLGQILAHTASVAHTSEPLSIAAAFGGVVPSKWGIAIQNQTGAALAASGNSVGYDEIAFA